MSVRESAPVIRTFQVTPHAIERALDMGVDGAEIRAALTAPESTYYSTVHGGWNYQAGRVCVGTRWVEGVTHVVTVLWSNHELWESDAHTAPLPQGRELRSR